MQTFTAPLRDMRFCLYELLGLESLTAIPRFADLSPGLIDSVLEAAATLATEVLLPINASGDIEGCTLENGVVRTPAGFRAAYDAFRAGGWTSVASDPEWGGQGLPESVNKLVEEMICATNLAFSLYPGLTHGAAQALQAHGNDTLKQAYLPKLVDGTWSGTMCLTEAHCGTDLGMLRTRATVQDDGSYQISGSKIFISAGDHDLTENVIHLVLARLPDAPKGIKGVSMFLVPKFMPDTRARNGVVCTALEHKMGLRASATCQIAFDDATGWLVGDPHRGMQAMFTMMNAERLAVGIQGLGVAEASYQSAVAYARERLQGRSVSGAKRPDLTADPIIVHPDIRRSLLTMRACTEGFRALGLWVAGALDTLHSDDAVLREDAADFTALMTPIVKALFTDLGFEAASLGVQVYGGHGYIRDHGMEQYVRDARIAMIYEGANGIQALDLVGRKLGAHNGRLLRTFFHPVAAFIEAHRDEPMVAGFERAFKALQAATAMIAERGLRDPEEGAAAATDYLRLFGLVAVGFMWVRMSVVAHTALAATPHPNPPPQGGRVQEYSPSPLAGEGWGGGSVDAQFYKAKLDTARFYMERVLPQTAGLFAAIKAGKASLMNFEEAAF